MKPFTLLLLSLAVCSLLNVAGAQQTAFVQAAASAAPPAVNKTKMLQLVNAARSKGCRCGDAYFYAAPPLLWNDRLETAALDHTENMAAKKFFSHYAPDGSRGGDRIARAGYLWKTYGENIGEGFATEKDMLAAWLASPGHCKNIMNKSFTEMGVARVGNLWTQEFGSR